MNDYFVDNDKLRVVMLLLDSRILPTELDLQMLDFLATHDIPCVVILTKTDKLNRSEINNAINKVSTMIRYNKDLIIPTSATKKQGVEKIAILLDNYLS